MDVLVVGSLHERRRRILSQMQEAGLRVVSLFNKYGPERDAVIARAKIMLNMHLHAARMFEALRASCDLANGLCVLYVGS